MSLGALACFLVLGSESVDVKTALVLTQRDRLVVGPFTCRDSLLARGCGQLSLETLLYASRHELRSRQLALIKAPLALIVRRVEGVPLGSRVVPKYPVNDSLLDLHVLLKLSRRLAVLLQNDLKLTPGHSVLLRDCTRR